MAHIVADKLLSLVKQLFPRGRAYWIPIGFSIEKLMKAFAGATDSQMGTVAKLLKDGDNVFDSMIPDNPNFTDGTTDPNDNDCNDAERRWGIVQYGVTSVTTPTRAQRMAAIIQKMQFPGTNACRQAALYLQARLQAAGFNVFVYENLSNLTPADVLGIPVGEATYGGIDYGQADYGETYASAGVSVIANSVDPSIDATWVPGAVNYGTFFISGTPITTFATIPAIRETEFRQLVLSLKAQHMAAYCFITFT